MKIYSIYSTKEDASNLDNLVAIDQKFNFWAFLFNFFWALYYRFWLVAFIIFAAKFIVAYAYSSLLLNDVQFFILDMAIMIFLGMEASNIKEYYIKRRGVEYKGSVVANSVLHAKYEFLKS